MAADHEQIDVISTVILAVIVGAIGTVIYLIFLKPCTDSKDDGIDDKKSSKENGKGQEDKGKQNVSKSKKKVVKENSSLSNTSHPLLLTSLKGHTNTITGIDFSSNGKFLASCAEGKPQCVESGVGDMSCHTAHIKGPGHLLFFSLASGADPGGRAAGVLNFFLSSFNNFWICSILAKNVGTA